MGNQCELSINLVSMYLHNKSEPSNQSVISHQDEQKKRIMRVIYI